MAQRGVLRVLNNDELDELEGAGSDEDFSEREYAVNQLAHHIRTEYEYFRWHRSKHNLHRRYLENLRTYNGQYSSDKLQEIRRFGGSDVFARMTTVKCRGATALLRDVYLSGDRPWTMSPTPVPRTPEDVIGNVEALIQMEAQSLQMMGQPVDPEALDKRRTQLLKEADRATLKNAQEAAVAAEKRVDDILLEGAFYDAFSEFLTDIPIFPFACLKGPVVKNTTQLEWRDGVLVEVTKPKMYWTRVSPFDVYFTPGASRIEDCDVIERIKLSRKDLNALLGLPGYDEDAIRQVLNDYDEGLQDFLDEAETERADEENKENPYLNRSGLIDTLEYHGAVQGHMLLDYGFTDDQVDDPDKDYHVVAWVVGKHTIKVQINPNPNKRHPYYVTCFEKVPGSIYGNALPETLADAQAIANAALRSLANNMALASGPQVMVNEDRLSPTTDGDTLYPWKRWRFIDDPLAVTAGAPPISFFQPSSNSAELLGIYKEMMILADEVSAIPRYVTGGTQASGGAASTASGLSMLMNNASKVLQNVAASIDNDILKPCLQDLYMLVMLTDTTGLLRGDEQIVVRGVTVATQKETERMRRLEFLQMTANPMDSEIIGMNGRAALLRSIAEDLGLPEEKIVPTDDQLRAAQEAAQQAAQLEQAALAAGGGPPGMPGMPGQQGNPAAAAQGAQAPRPSNAQARLSAETDNMHRTNPPSSPLNSGSPTVMNR